METSKASRDRVEPEVDERGPGQGPASFGGTRGADYVHEWWFRWQKRAKNHGNTKPAGNVS